MSQTRVDFQFLGNDTAIDFVNTLVMDKDTPVDLVANSTDFEAWLREAGMTPSRSFTDDELEAVRGLRTALKAVFDAQVSGSAPSAQHIAVIDRHVSSYTPNMQLTYTGKNFTLTPRDDALTPEAILGKLAHIGAELLASVKDGALKSCSNPQCVLMYKDISRGLKRRWCSMKTCGNRAKVAAFRETSV